MKVKTLDLLVLIAEKTRLYEKIKLLLQERLNPIYY